MNIKVSKTVVDGSEEIRFYNDPRQALPQELELVNGCRSLKHYGCPESAFSEIGR